MRWTLGIDGVLNGEFAGMYPYASRLTAIAFVLVCMNKHNHESHVITELVLL